MRSPKDFPKFYAETVRNAQVDAFTDLYEDNVRIFDMWDQWSLQGKAACEVMAKEWFSSLGDEHVVVTFSDVEVLENEDLALVTGFVRFAGHAADGKRLRFLDERMTVHLRRQNSGDWKVTHQHSSSPVDSNGMKIKMVRENT